MTNYVYFSPEGHFVKGFYYTGLITSIISIFPFFKNYGFKSINYIEKTAGSRAA